MFQFPQPNGLQIFYGSSVVKKWIACDDIHRSIPNTTQGFLLKR